MPKQAYDPDESEETTLVLLCAGDATRERSVHPANLETLLAKGMIERFERQIDGDQVWIMVRCTAQGKAAAKATGRVGDLW